MTIKQKTVLIINRVWLALNIVSLFLCVWFYLGIQVTRKYDIDNSLNPTREQIIDFSKSYLDSSENLLCFIAIILLINIIILFINQSKTKIT